MRIVVSVVSIYAAIFGSRFFEELPQKLPEIEMFLTLSDVRYVGVVMNQRMSFAVIN